jgi:hypothetical protein
VAGPAGEAGPPGPKGEPGDPGMALRLVRGNGPAASCRADEVMISAFCTGQYSRYPLTTTETGAKCGPDIKSNTVAVTIVCAKM